MNWKKTKEFTFINIIGIIIISLCFMCDFLLATYDTYWNYGYSMHIINGLVPYRDFNFLAGPIAPIFYSIPLIFSKTITAYQINKIIKLLMCIFIFKYIFKDFKNKRIATFYLILASLYFSSLDITYSSLIIILQFLSIAYFVKIIRKNEIKIFDIFLLSLIGMIAFYTKQSTGAFLAVAIFVCIAFLSIQNHLIKNCLFNIFFNITIFGLVCFLFYKLNAFDDYVNIALLGISGFVSANRGYTLLIIAIIFSLFVFIFNIKIYKKYKNKTMFIICIICISQVIGCYPVANISHFLLYITPFSLYFIYLSNIVDKEIISETISIITMIIFTIFYVRFSSLFSFQNLTFSNISNIGYALNDYRVVKEFEEELVEKRKEDNNLIIFATSAQTIGVITNSYHKYYDLFICGGTGKLSANEIFEEIKYNKFAIPKNNEIFSQIPEEIVNRVKSFEIVDETNYYYIYQNNQN